MPGQEVSLGEYFADFGDAVAPYDAVRRCLKGIGDFETRVTTSQIAFRRRVAFAWAWIPEKHLRRRAAPLVLSVALRRRDSSPRWKQVVEPRPGRFMHHLELTSPGDVDDEVRRWLAEAWEDAC